VSPCLRITSPSAAKSGGPPATVLGPERFARLRNLLLELNQLA